ncbi:MAG: ATP-binding protein [Cyclobacteriaceae bacterium]|nr:ATP-binding protein [Cyclobacteriaceae bacterium]MDW8331917.1 ATP-binding protein [Cyclobacteriaceae bacterium]
MKHSYKVGCSIQNLRGIREFIRGALRPFGISEMQISELVLAIDEMSSNLMIHAHQCNPDDLFELTIEVQNDKVIVELVDEKNVFDINAFKEPSLGELISEKRKGGLGIRLVKSIMDSVEYQQRDGHHVCRLTKKLQKT